ncbi:MAG TPA: hypothetical protein VGF76_24705, partial [Polyangiaceae bacterium]
AHTHSIERHSSERPIPSQSSTFSKASAPSSRREPRFSALAPLGCAASPASSRPPPLPAVPLGTEPTAASPSSTLEAVVTPISILVDEEAFADAAAFRSSPLPKLWVVLVVLAIGGALAIAALTRVTPTKASEASAPIAVTQLERAASPAVAGSDHSRRALPSLLAVQPGVNALRAVDPRSAATARAASPAPRAASSSKAAQPGAKDYGI